MPHEEKKMCKEQRIAKLGEDFRFCFVFLFFFFSFPQTLKLRKKYPSKQVEDFTIHCDKPLNVTTEYRET